MPEIDYIIVGQGLAGSIIACLCEMRGKTVIVIDDEHRTSASLAAAGIMNPITGKRLNRPHFVDQLLASAFDVYPRVEQFLGTPIFERRNVLRILKSEDEFRHWKQKLVTGEYAKYLGSTTVAAADYVEQKYGGFEIAKAGFLDVPRFVRAVRDWLLTSGKLINEGFQYGDVSASVNQARWQGNSAKAIIFCEGYQLKRNPFFSSIAMNPAKGEVLTLDTNHFADNRVIQHQKWLLRTIDGQIKAGTTYSWDNLDETPSPAARIEIEQSLRSFVQFDFKVTRQVAGVRPVTKVDNRPVIGVHPLHKRLAILNGLGSKGVLQAPFAACQLMAYLEKGEPIHPDFDVCRKSLWE
jgi:glycine/D-amino acid oxidase-like deaminating enzyme